MADPRLRYQNTAAPSFAGVSEAMARGNAAFNRGMESASGVLQKYSDGLVEQADNELVAELAGLKNEGEFDAWIDGGALQGRNISEGMRNKLLGARTQYIGDDGVRARTAGTRSGTMIAQARESRTATDWQDGIARRDAQRGAAGAIQNANQFSANNGQSIDGQITQTGGGGMDEREILARTLQAEAGNQGYDGMLDVGSVIANRGASGRWGNSLSDVILADGQFSAWNGVTGYAGGEQGQDMLNMSVGQEAYAAADAILSGNYNDRTGGATHYVNDSISRPAWLGQLNANGSTRLGAHLFGNPDNSRRYDGKSWLNPQAQPGGPAGQTIPGQSSRQPSGNSFTGPVSYNDPLAQARNQLVNTGLFNLC